MGSGPLLLAPGQVWGFFAPHIGCYANRDLIEEAGFTLFGSVVLTFPLETRIQLYVVMPDKAKGDDTVQQPKGYPRNGENLTEEQGELIPG